MGGLEIRLDADRRTYLPGEQIAGTAAWRLSDPPERLEIRLFWYTRGKGTRDVSITARVPIERPLAAGDREFSFKAPRAPYSFSGRLVSLVWALELVAHPGGESERLDITVSSNGEEVDITQRPGDGT